RLGGNPPDVGHELGCGAETTQITRFGDQRDGTQEADPAERLERADKRHLAGGLSALVEGRLQAFDAFTSRRHLGQVLGEDDAVWQVLELELPQPLEVALRPVAHTDGWPAALTQQ